MKYFTPDLYQRMQDCGSEQAIEAADADWERAATRYRRHLRRIWAGLPKGVRTLLDNFYVHDADVLSMGQQGQTFVMVVRLDAPPNELLFLHYRLTREPVIEKGAFVAKGVSGPVQWMYDEVGQARNGQAGWT